MNDTKKDFIKYLVKEEGLNANSAEYELALDQYGSDSEDDLFYSEFLDFFNKEKNRNGVIERGIDSLTRDIDLAREAMDKIKQLHAKALMADVVIFLECEKSKLHLLLTK